MKFTAVFILMAFSTRSPITFENLRERTIILDGWSKTYAMTGWRLGWSYWPQDLIDLAERMAINIHSCVNAATQLAGLEP